MTRALWTVGELVAACGGERDGIADAEITGFSIDTRTLDPGDVFVALKDRRDGHDFVPDAFDRGAAAALVEHSYLRQPGDRLLIRVENALAALQAIGGKARSRLDASARVIAVTGSVGKTGTKEMLRACLSAAGPTHAADKSFNNHWGVPLTLARMPAGTRFAVFEIGMNHAGEISPLTRLVRPHVAIVTTVEPVHLGYFGSVEEIADAKAEIFLGLEPRGVAILNRDNAQFDRLKNHAAAAGARIVTFGRDARADVRPDTLSTGWTGSDVTVTVAGRSLAYRLSVPGLHVAMNSLGVVAALAEVLSDDADVGRLLRRLEGLRPPEGRGLRFTLTMPAGEALLIDESYNANPASMRAALAAMAAVPRNRFHRRIAVLGDMLELGRHADSLHEELKEAVDAAGADLVFACGPHMRRLFEVLPAARQARWADSSEGLRAPLLETVTAGDVVMIKGSLGSRMAPLVEALKERAVSVRA